MPGTMASTYRSQLTRIHPLWLLPTCQIMWEEIFYNKRWLMSLKTFGPTAILVQDGGVKTSLSCILYLSIDFQMCPNKSFFSTFLSVNKEKNAKWLIQTLWLSKEMHSKEIPSWKQFLTWPHSPMNLGSHFTLLCHLPHLICYMRGLD